jgi:hypothetical protein
VALSRHMIRALALPFFVLVSTAGASIRVVDDEVYFTLKAPGAKEVYIVGDFNNWNATVEKMEQSGNLFEISLYLVEGNYHYKFVVDGDWIVDPDNPGYDPARGSPIFLVEKPAGLMLRAEDPARPAARPTLKPVFRYINQSRWNRPGDAGFEDDHYLDFGLGIDREKLRGDVVIRTYDNSWETTNKTLEITLDGAYAGTDVAGLYVDAFENYDIVKNSSDPFTLVGDVGVYDYNAGFTRKGATASYLFLDAIRFNAVYADHTGQVRGIWPVLPPGGQYNSSRQKDNITYTWEAGAGGSDLFGFEILVESGDFQGGIVTRSNRGLNPGTLSQFNPADSITGVYDTVENNGTYVYWLRLKKLFGIGAVLGYGRANSEIQQLAWNRWQTTPSGNPVPLGQTAGINQTAEFEKSDRFTAGLDMRSSEDLTFAAAWDRSTFDFTRGAYSGSEATVDRVSLWSAFNPAGWRISLAACYTDQDYGDTPPELLIDSPAKNMWLDWRDKFLVADIVGIDTDSYTDVKLAALWHWSQPVASSEETPEEPAAQPAWIAAKAGAGYPDPANPGPGVRAELGTTTLGFLKSSQYSYARLRAAWLFRGSIHTQVDGRYSVYDKPEWGESQSFVCGYVEAGYLYRWLAVNLGWGMDPVVFDATRSDFYDIGRTEVLRQSITGGVRRGESEMIGERLLSLEKQLRDVQTIKLELIIRF